MPNGFKNKDKDKYIINRNNDIFVNYSNRILLTKNKSVQELLENK